MMLCGGPMHRAHALIPIILAFICCLSTVRVSADAVAKPWMKVGDDPAKRARTLLAQMTLDEKIAMLHGPTDSRQSTSGCQYTGFVVGNARLGIPPLQMNDGPQGFRDNDHRGTTTAWPSGLTMAATWDSALMLQWGQSMGAEFRNKGANIQLGPGVNVARLPQNGRNFEYLSGEDPFLGYTLVQPVVRGIQSQGVIANAKHYVLNNQELNRDEVSAIVDERTRFEMFYAPFEGAVEAGVGSMMCSYNKIAGAWSCENNVTLAGDLKDRLGFAGFVMSDWGATHSPSIREGLDMEMPSALFMGQTLQQLVQNGTIDPSFVDSSVLRILTQMFAIGLFDGFRPDPSLTCTNNVTSAEHNDLARRFSAAATVLLKNDGNLLPIDVTDATIKSIAVIGKADAASTITHGGGSGAVDPSRIVTPVQGITNVLLAAGRSDVQVHFDDGTDLNRARDLAQSVSLALVFVGATNGREGHDRPTLAVDFMNDDLVEHISRVQQRLIVCVSAPGAVLLPWRDRIPALLLNFIPGQEVGNAIADVLFGAVNPSARLPVTIPLTDNDQQFSLSQYPGLPADRCLAQLTPCTSTYSEGMFFGYRFYDFNSLEPMFPFGYGLSYTSFAYGDIAVQLGADQSAVVTFTLQNTGSRAGAEVAQVYVGSPPPAGRPPRALRGFQKVYLQPGEKQRVSVTLAPRSFQMWDANDHQWTLLPGYYQISVGASSRDFRLNAQVNIPPSA